MASPFKVFRKHQKFMLALLGVLVMVGFVILPAIMQGMGQQTRANPRVATTKNYGDLRSSKLVSLRWRRQLALRFFDALGRALIMAGANPAPVEMAKREMTPNQEVSPISDEALVETWLLGRRAEELGLVVDDATISAFLRNLMQDRITQDDLTTLLRNAEISDKQLLSVLRQELLAMRLRGIFRLSVQGTTPAERWDYFQRLNRKVTIESLPVPVNQFLDEVEDPDDATLRDFFEEYKAVPHDPTSPEPGFRVPKKVAVEYLKADYESFFQRAVEDVTLEEVKEYYEGHKDDYRKEELPADDEEPVATDSEAKAEDGESAAPESSGEPEEPASQEAAPDQEMPADEAGAQAPETESDSPPPSGETPPATDKPAEAEPANEEPAEAESTEEASPGATGAADETSSTGVASPFRLASFLAEDAAPEETAEAEQPAEAPAPQAETVAEGAAGAEAESAAATPEEGDVAAAEPKYLPLEEVEEEIRNKLARDKANETIEKSLRYFRSEMDSYHEQSILSEVESEETPGKKPLEKLDFKAFAEKNGLIAGESGMVSALEAERLDIGKSSLGPTSFIEAVFEQLPKHRPEISRGTDDDYYLFWKVDEAEERVPEFEDAGVRERVVREWKKRAARILARQKAEQMAAKAREDGKPLAELFSARANDVAVSKPFSWLTYGAIQPWMAYAPPSLSAVEGVDTPGDDFMRAVFALKKGEVGASMNQPQTVAYVVRLTDSNPLPEVLWSQFTAESYLSYFRASWHDQSMAEEAWLDGIKKEVGFAWDPAWQRETARR